MHTIKFLMAALLSAANLATSAPVAQGDPATFCGLDTYQSVGQRAVRNNLLYLNSTSPYNAEGQRPPDVLIGKAGTCTVVACFGQASTSLCVNAGADYSAAPAQFGKDLTDTYVGCYRGMPAKSDNAIASFQFFGVGYNLLVQGAADCKAWKQGVNGIGTPQ
jgi:hypothetical protein